MASINSKNKMMVIVNPSRCLGCRSCEVQCAVAHSKSKDIQKIIRDGEKPGHRISVEAYGRKAVPVHCQHCEEPACVLACPTGALERKADGKPVLADRERCIGCSMCVQACPFGVIAMGPDGKGVLKCDMCIERLAQGIEPACVEACPTKALTFARAEESNKEKRRKLAERLALAEDASKKE